MTDLLLTPPPPLRVVEGEPWPVAEVRLPPTPQSRKRALMSIINAYPRAVADAMRPAIEHEARRFFTGGPAYVWPEQEPVVTERAWRVT